MVELACEVCGSPFRVKPYMAGKAHFCGAKCYGTWQQTQTRPAQRRTVSLLCHGCWTPIALQPCAVKARNFCGRPCFYRWRGRNKPAPTPWRRGYQPSYRGPNWKAQRESARARDGHRCQDCGKPGRSLPVHHIVPFRLWGNYREANDLLNLITFCDSCHMRAEAEFWRQHRWIEKEEGLRSPFLFRDCERCGKSFPTKSFKARVCEPCHVLTCQQCGKRFESTRPLVQRFCSYACCKKVRAKTAQKARLRVCAGCGELFRSHHKTATYCSNRCHVTQANPRRAFFAGRNRAAPASGQNGA